MTDKEQLTKEDRERIASRSVAFADSEYEKLKSNVWNALYESGFAGAEYATIYERKICNEIIFKATQDQADTIVHLDQKVKQLEAERTELIEYNNNLEKTLRICLTIKPHTESVDTMKAMINTLLNSLKTK